MNIFPHLHTISKEERSAIKGHKPAVLFFTGLSGSGKSTIANEVERALNQKYQAHTYLLDGDNIRNGLNKNLGFSKEDREENIRRIGEVCNLFHDAGMIVLASFISPFNKDRDNIRVLIPDNGFIEIFVDCPLEICEERDPKGLYKKARSGEIEKFTGISSPYEAPENPEIIIKAGEYSVIECADQVVDYLLDQEIIKAK